MRNISSHVFSIGFIQPNIVNTRSRCVSWGQCALAEMGKHRRNKEVEEEEDIAKDVKKKSRKKSKSKSKDVEKSAGDQTPRKRSKSDLSEKEKKKKRMKKDKKRKRDNDGETEERVHKKRKKSSKSASPSAPSSFVASTPAQKKSMEDFRNQEGIEVDGSEKDWLPIFAFADTGFDSEILDITKVHCFFLSFFSFLSFF